MAKLTRKSYRRKKVLFGVCLFTSIALISTGFAAFVISSSASAEQSGNVNVGYVQDSTVKFSDVAFADGNTIQFEAAAGDFSGRIINDGQNSESLKVTITGKVSPVTYLKALSFSLEVPQSIKDAAEANYIVLPDCATSPIELQKNALTAVENDPNALAFSYDVEFKWGSVFGGMNPSLYYDNDEQGMLVPTETAKATMNEFRNLAYGAEEFDLSNIQNPSTTLEFKLKIDVVLEND